LQYERSFGYAPGLYYVLRHRSELLVQRTPPLLEPAEIAFMPVVRRIREPIVHFNAAEHEMGVTHLPLTECGNIEAFAFVPCELTADATLLCQQFSDGRLQLCAGRRDGWLIAKRPEQLFAPGCADDMQVILDVQECIRVDRVCPFDAACPSLVLTSQAEPQPLTDDDDDDDDHFGRLRRWPTDAEKPEGHTAVILAIYFMRRQVVPACPALEFDTLDR
jgi:hypothetical protein